MARANEHCHLHEDGTTNGRDSQERALRDELSALDGTAFEGHKCVISIARTAESKQRLFLSGIPYLFTLFAERAYELDEPSAKRLIERYPDVFTNAQIHLRG